MNIKNGTKEFNKIYGNNSEITMNDVEYIRKTMIELGSLDYAKNKLEHYYKQAKSKIGNITKAQEKEKLLTDFLDYLIKREK